MVIYFQDQSKLFYNDQRQFGFWQVVNSKELKEVQDKLGLNPLYAEFSLSSFKKLLENRKGNIKAFLLNQKYIAGLGNIYTDESLFKARILPSRKINTLNTGGFLRLASLLLCILQRPHNLFLWHL